MALGVVQHQLFTAAPALADDIAKYDASGVSDSLKNAFGVAYVAVLIGFGIRLFNKRAQRFTTEVTPPLLTAASFLHHRAMVTDVRVLLQRLASPYEDDAAARPDEAEPVGWQEKPSPFGAL